MKNYTTPRLMRDGQWTIGSVSASASAPWRFIDVVWAVACFAACVTVGVILAIGV
jgi:ABC-type multidrug transport system permease subunit